MYSVKIDSVLYYHATLLVFYVFLLFNSNVLAQINLSLSNYFLNYIDRFFTLLLFSPSVLQVPDRFSLLYLIIHTSLISLILITYTVRFILLIPVSYFLSSYVVYNESTDLYYFIASTFLFVSSILA